MKGTEAEKRWEEELMALMREQEEFEYQRWREEYLERWSDEDEHPALDGRPLREPVSNEDWEAVEDYEMGLAEEAYERRMDR